MRPRLRALGLTDLQRCWLSGMPRPPKPDCWAGFQHGAIGTLFVGRHVKMTKAPAKMVLADQKLNKVHLETCVRCAEQDLCGMDTFSNQDAVAFPLVAFLLVQ
jgi:hypothetical protein